MIALFLVLGFAVAFILLSICAFAVKEPEHDAVFHTADILNYVYLKDRK